MQTQIQCPQCGTPYSTEVHQIVDSKRTPALKQQLLNGSLNLAVCPQCGAGGQLTTLLLFHDPDHEMFMVYLPQEMNLNQMQREQAIGRLTKQVMDNLPPEERRAYMLQPQVMINMQTFMENVLQTEGVTKEMIARQRQQAELLQKLIGADQDVQDYLLKDRLGEIDETFFAMLQSYIDMANQMNDDRQLIPLVNLRARLMTGTPAGRRLEQQQVAVHKLGRAAKQQGGLSPSLLLEHIVANEEQPHLVEALVNAGQQALRYEFFSELTAEIDKRAAAGDKAAATRLTSLRDDLLKRYDAMQNESRQILERATQTLQAILEAPDKAAALDQHADRIDDAFMYVLSARLGEAEQKGDNTLLQALNEVQALILEQVEDQLPPEIQLLNQLVRAETAAEQEQILAENPDLLSEELLAVMDRVIEQAGASDQSGINGRLRSIKSLIAARL